MKKSMQATSLRRLLIVVILLILAGGTVAFYYGVVQIKAFAIEANHINADAEASASNIDKLRTLKQALADSETLIDKANKVFATDANYQSQGLKDVQKYAKSFGLTISSTNFDTKSSENSTLASSSAKSFMITLQSPVNYKGLLQFLNAIEGNLPKMQVTSLTVSRPPSGNADVVVGDITIGISTR